MLLGLCGEVQAQTVPVNPQTTTQTVPTVKTAQTGAVQKPAPSAPAAKPAPEAATAPAAKTAQPAQQQAPAPKPGQPAPTTQGGQTQPAPVQAKPKPAPANQAIDRLYVFGDSYSDTGRGWVDSDGPTAVAYMAQKMGLTLVPANAKDVDDKSLNFAVSGAPTGENVGHPVTKGWLGLGMKNQVAEFVARQGDGSIEFDPDSTIFFIAGGLNDKKLTTEQTVANLEGEIKSLYDAGARRFRVAILPEKIPAFSEVGIRLNPALKNIPAEMKTKLPDVEIKTSQWGAFFDAVMDNAAKYGITDTTNQCAGREIFEEDATPCASPATHFYYHKGHPSKAVHKIVGGMLYEEMTGKPAAH
ncbi:MAG TPA: SGNH/GDSL hydrolase family protein [Edaphobacter sp.]